MHASCQLVYDPAFLSDTREPISWTADWEAVNSRCLGYFCASGKTVMYQNSKGFFYGFSSM